MDTDTRRTQNAWADDAAFAANARDELDRLVASLTPKESDLIQLILIQSRCVLGGPFLDSLRVVTSESDKLRRIAGNS
jgi:hypothetical protein